MRLTQRISFDFDDTLVHSHIQLLAERFINWGDEVFIVTSRRSKVIDEVGNAIGNITNDDLFEIADEIGIKRSNIFFTETNPKLPTLLENRINLHFDDDLVEILSINGSENESIHGILVGCKKEFLNGL